MVNIVKQNMLKVENRKRNYKKTTDDKYKKYYLIHHMHHFKSGNNVEHNLHHCFLFSKKNMEGKRHKIIHKVFKDNIYHCIEKKYEETLYDHANNAYKIIPKKIIKKKIYEIKF